MIIFRTTNRELKAVLAYEKSVIFASIGVFIATYIPLMAKVYKIMVRDNSEINSIPTES